MAEPENALENSPVGNSPASAVPPGTGTTDDTATLLRTVERASVAAVAQHEAESPVKRGRGRPRKIPLGPMGDGAVSSPLAADEAPCAPLAFEPAPPAFDEATARVLVETAVTWLNGLGAAVVRAVALRETNDPSIATEAEKNARMSEKVQTTLQDAGVRLARKYSVHLEYADEIICVGCLGAWAAGNFIAIKNLKAAGGTLRGAPAPAEENKIYRNG